jgi:hypothetical protein
LLVRQTNPSPPFLTICEGKKKARPLPVGPESFGRGCLKRHSLYEGGSIFVQVRKEHPLLRRTQQGQYRLLLLFLRPFIANLAIQPFRKRSIL